MENDEGGNTDTLLHGRKSESQTDTNPQTNVSNRTYQDSDLRAALEMSQLELLEAERLRREEDEELERILKLSLTEK